MTGATEVGGPCEVLARATAELLDVAGIVESLIRVSEPTIELIEAKRAVHGALVSLHALDSAIGSVSPAETTPQGQRVSLGGNRASRPPVVGWSVPPPDSVPVSILYDDLLVPMNVASPGPRTPSVKE
jgi:hypothetical protein